jgi:DNA-binding MarR family transcriptional regulator
LNKNDKKEALNLPDYTINNILIAGNWMNERFSEHLKQYALSIQQYKVLRSLRNLNGEATDLLTLQAGMISKNSNTTRLVEKLRLKGLISRIQNEENRRKVSIEITETGLNLLDEIDITQANFEKSTVANLNTNELKTLNKLLNKMRNK